MGTELKLKLRDRTDSISVPIQSITNWFELEKEAAKDAMYEFFEPLEGTKPKVHDKEFYERTVNWSPITVTPRGNVAVGIPMMEQLRWHRIGRDLQKIKDDEEGIIEFRNKDIELIWKRWNNDEFKMESIYQNPWIFDCIFDFMEATNRWPDEEEESLKEMIADEGTEDEEVSSDPVAEAIAEGVPVKAGEDGRS